MPGFNQRGPMNDGPMTGGCRGICTGEGGSGQRIAGKDALGYGRRMGRRNVRRGCQAYGRRMDFNEGFGQQPAQKAFNKDSLKTRAKFLEAELAAVKKELKDLSE